jgi:hypothetical protein
MYWHLCCHLAQARREGRFPDLTDTLLAVEKDTLRQLLTGWRSMASRSWSAVVAHVAANG